MNNKILKEKLTAEATIAEWRDLRGHVMRDGLLIVSSSLNLIDVGLAFANDNKAAVEQWLQENKIFKPSAEYLNKMEQNLSKKFSFIILQPFVLIQELLN